MMTIAPAYADVAFYPTPSVSLLIIGALVGGAIAVTVVLILCLRKPKNKRGPGPRE